MEQPIKRLKSTKESSIVEIASSIDDIAKSVKSISESYGEILKMNKAVVTYLQNNAKYEERVNLDHTVADLERTSITDNE